MFSPGELTLKCPGLLWVAKNMSAKETGSFRVFPFFESLWQGAMPKNFPYFEKNLIASLWLCRECFVIRRSQFSERKIFLRMNVYFS